MTFANIRIRETVLADLKDVLAVEQEAFDSDVEADLVEELLNDRTATPVLSLLAFKNAKPAGHILFTRARLETDDQNTSLLPCIYILAPLAVIPEYQGQGIGGMLVKEGVKRLRQTGADLVFVLGHEEYYPKYGFIQNAHALGFRPPFPILPKHHNAWMIQALSSKDNTLYRGRIVCADAMNKLEYWQE